MRTWLGLVGVLSAASLALAGCGGGLYAKDGPVPAGPLDRVSGTLTVDADPALSDVFDQLATAVERQHPKLTVRIHYTSTVLGGSDVVASFSRSTMGRLERQGAVGQARVAAQQAPVLVVAPRNPAAVGVLEDLGHPGVATALCETGTDCGMATKSLLTDAHVSPSRVRRVPDSEAALQTVSHGTTDAAVVWASDVRGRSGQAAVKAGVREVVFSPDPQRNIRLVGLGSRPVLIATASKGNALAAKAFVEQLRSSSGQLLLRDEGFR